MVRPGQTFLRHLLINLAKLVKRPHLHLRLSYKARSDLEWWFQFAAKWNRVSMLRTHHLPGGGCLTSDVSGRWGCGAFSKQSWFKVQWLEAIQQAHIQSKKWFLSCWWQWSGVKDGPGIPW